MAIHCNPLSQMLYSHTRKQALKDIHLINITEQAKQA